MKHKDRQYGLPYANYRDTKSNIESIPDVQPGAIAYATDTGELGVRRSTQWIWIGGTSGDMTKAVYDTDNDGVVDAAESVPWSGVTGKPSTFPPDAHNHDDRYYTETELNTSGAGGQVHWNNVTSKPSTYPPSTHQHAAGDVTSGTFDAARIPNLDAGKIASGTLSTDRYSAYADLQAENMLGMAQDRVLRGQDVRLIYALPTEDFLGSGIPSGWYWAGSPFVTPNTIYKISDSHLLVQHTAAAPSRCFLVSNISPTQLYPALFGISIVGVGGTYVGLRKDDGTDNNYVELVYKANSGALHLRSIGVRWRLNGGAINEVLTFDDAVIYPTSIATWHSGTLWSNWNWIGDVWLHIGKHEYIASTGASGLAFTPQRYGVVFYFAETWHRCIIDAVS